MSSYKTDQCRLLHRGAEFHFVSYEGHGENVARGETAAPAMWYLMRAGRRHEVMPQVAGQEESDRDRQLKAWLDAHVFGAPALSRVDPRRRTG